MGPIVCMCWHWIRVTTRRRDRLALSPEPRPIADAPLHLLFCTIWYVYQMVRWVVATSQARDRILDAAVEHALSEGIVDLSLRDIAASIGTSHRMIIYHFGSREGLLVAVVREVERRERQTLGDAALSVTDARRLWDRLADPSLRPQERLFFEIYSHALLGRPGTEGFLEEALESWLSLITESMLIAGINQTEARTVARLGWPSPEASSSTCWRQATPPEPPGLLNCSPRSSTRPRCSLGHRRPQHPVPSRADHGCPSLAEASALQLRCAHRFSEPLGEAEGHGLLRRFR